LENEKGRLRQVKDDRNEAVNTLFELGRQKLTIEIAQLVIQEAAHKTQAELSWYINDMVSAAIESVFPEDDYQFYLEFVQRRGKTEADLFLADAKGNKVKPSDAEGGGLVDIVSFALRICLWSLTKSSRKTIILDEPLKFLSRDLLPKAGELVKTLSERLGLQIIMVSHLDELIDEADKVIEIKKVKGVSHVRTIKGDLSDM
jgi:DNA repair exonuclease SbcCD ATPase subunit